jgi:diguanylate cyclase (GGDEF)-like protein
VRTETADIGAIDIANSGATMNDQALDPSRPAVGDGLTGFANRAALEVVVEYAIGRARRDGECLTLLRFAIDGMDDIIATYGNAGGDAALVEFGTLVRTELRASDVIARIGDDEFAVLLGGTEADEAGVVVNHLSGLIRARNAEPGHPFALRARVTRASFEPDSEFSTLDALLDVTAEKMRAGAAVSVQ